MPYDGIDTYTLDLRAVDTELYPIAIRCEKNANLVGSIAIRTDYYGNEKLKGSYTADQKNNILTINQPYYTISDALVEKITMRIEGPKGYTFYLKIIYPLGNSGIVIYNKCQLIQNGDTISHDRKDGSLLLETFGRTELEFNIIGLTGNEPNSIAGLYTSSTSSGHAWTGEDETFKAYWIHILKTLAEDDTNKYSWLCKTNKGDFTIEYN